MKWRTFLVPMFLALTPFVLTGCANEGLETGYGRIRGASLNGTGVFAELLRSEGHTVRSAVRLTHDLEEWADVIVRFAPYPGPPDRNEGDWYHSWLSAKPERRMIYVAADFDARAEYWSDVLDHLPPGTDEQHKKLATRERDLGLKWYEHRSTPPKEVADAAAWFAVSKAKDGPKTCKELDGPWAEGIEAKAASLSRHETFKVESETVLLEGDGAPLVIEWGRYNDSRVLALANGSFLLNAALLKQARRPLALQVVGWLGEEPAHIAFVEGGAVAREAAAMPSVFSLLRVHPFGWVAAQLMLVGLVACLARAPRLGRVRSVASSGEDRPSAHPEALGSLLARTRQSAEALAILDAYRRWRFSSNPLRVSHAPSLEERPEPVPNSESPAHE